MHFPARLRNQNLMRYFETTKSKKTLCAAFDRLAVFFVRKGLEANDKRATRAVTA
jgi:hypothetical protein